MKTTGIVRKVDELGRVVLPIELHRTLQQQCGNVAVSRGDGVDLRYESRRMTVRSKRMRKTHQAGWHRRRHTPLSQQREAGDRGVFLLSRTTF